MSGITNITAEEIKDSRGKPTIRVTVFADEVKGSFDVPSGASTGEYEAHVLPVEKSIATVQGVIKEKLMGMPVTDQRQIDETMLDLDGTANKSILGGNSMIGVSIAVARCAAAVQKIELFEHLQSLSSLESTPQTPKLFMNLINGGAHAEGGSVIQEHQVVISGVTVVESIERGREIQRKLKELINDKVYKTGDEGGVVFEVRDVFEPFELLKEAADGVPLGADAAASSFFENGVYKVDGKELDANELLELYNNIDGLEYLEDPFEENDFASFARIKNETELTIIGDDLTTTNVERLTQAINARSITSLIIKPNQIGTLTETIQTIERAHNSGIHCIVSHRSGETMDTFIADLVRAFYCYGMKAGAWGQKEREVKYQRLMELY